MPRKTKLPAILILREKHGDQLFFIQDEANLHAVALEIVTKRQKSGYYYNPSYENPKELDFTEEQIANMPIGSIQNEARKKMRTYKQELHLFEEDKKQLERIAEAVKNKNGQEAWVILKELRGDYEYEGLSLEQPLQPGEYRA